MPVPTSAMPTLFAKFGKTETASATPASTSLLRPSSASNRDSSMLPQVSNVKPKPSVELITDMYQAITHVNTLLPPFKFALLVANFSILQALHVRPELTVDVNNTSQRPTHASPALTLRKLAHAEDSGTTLRLVFAKTSPSAMLTNTTSCSHPLTLALMPLPQLVSALPGSATTTTESLANAKPGLTAMPRPRSLIKIITSASPPTLSLSSTVPTRTSTSTLQHASARPSPYVTRASNCSVTLAIPLQTVTTPSLQSLSKSLVTTSNLVIPNALAATVSALRTEPPM